VLKLAEQFLNVLYVVPAIAQTKLPAEAREVALFLRTDKPLQEKRSG
jgi:hypothetical protein